MKKIFPLLTVCLISGTGCLHRAPSLKMLEQRANYSGDEKADAAKLRLASGGDVLRIPPRTAHIWIFPHETVAKEYFWGGWISVVVEGDRWAVGSTEARQPDKPMLSPGGADAK